jgi:hypothetical protein
MKIIFLDFDGPIIPAQSHQPERPIDKKAWPSSVDALNRVTDTTGAVIVISSNWRGRGLRKIQALLKSWGVTGKVIGTTPILFDKIGGIWKATPRGEEIAKYLRDKKEVESFVILDDDTDMGELEPYLIQTPFDVGLTEKDADLAIDMLTRPRTVRLL